MYVLLIASIFLGLDFFYFNVLLKPNDTRTKGSAFAKFTPGAIISEIRNKIAATVYTKNKAGMAIRNRTTPINRRSSGQSLARQTLASISSGWRGLTQAQRDGWNSAAASFPQQDNLGNTIFLTGAQLYQRSNNNLALIGEAPIVDAPSPTSFDILAFTSLTMDASSGTVSLAFTPTVPAGFAMVVRATAPISAGKSFVPRSSFRYLDTIAAAATSPQDIAAAYIAVFGAITSKAGQKVFAEFFLVEVATGLAGIPVSGYGIIVP